MITPVQEKQYVRLFVGIPIPERVVQKIQLALGVYKREIEKEIPSARWHITIAFLGECSDPTPFLETIGASMLQSYVPTVTISHLGRGLAEGQLWAYVLPTPLLKSIRQEVTARIQGSGLISPGLSDVREFVPHIHVATLRPEVRASLPDSLASITFPLSNLFLYKSEVLEKERQYTPLTSISLTHT